MKKLIQKIRLRKFPKVYIDKISGEEFIILYDDKTYKHIWNKEDLIIEIQCRNKDIYYIFDMADKIILDRDIDINANGIWGVEYVKNKRWCRFRRARKVWI